MEIVRRSVLAVLAIAFVLPAALAAAEPSNTRGLVLPIAGSGSGGIKFSGTVTVQRFRQRDGQVVAIGAVSGSVSGPSGTIGTALVLPVEFPVRIGSGLGVSVEPAGLRPASLSTSGGSPRLLLAQATTCSVLHLDLAAIDLNVQGATVTTTPVTIDINGDTGGALGNLVCAVLNTVNNVAGLVNLLNSLLGVVTGLVGGLAGGLGGAVPM